MAKNSPIQANEVLDARTHKTLAEGQSALIDALAEGDTSRGASALAELRLALRTQCLGGQDAGQALAAIDDLGNMLRHSHGIHDHPAAAA